LVTTKVITIKKRGGGTRRQAVEVLKSGKFKFIKNTSAKLKSKARKVGKVVRSATKRRTAGKKTNKEPSRSHRSSMKQSTVSKLYKKQKASEIAIKAGIGGLIGIAIRLGTMFHRDPRVRALGFRAANVGAGYGGGGSGVLVFQGVDFALQTAMLQRNNGNGGISASAGQIVGAA